MEAHHQLGEEVEGQVVVPSLDSGVALDYSSAEEAAHHIRIEAAEVASVDTRSRTEEVEGRRIHRCMAAVRDFGTAYEC